MLERNQGSLTNNTVIAALARVKTLSIVRQLDSNGKSGQLTPSQNPLDLSTADLNNMNSSISELPIVTNHTTSLSQAGSNIRMVTFMDTDISIDQFHSAVSIQDAKLPSGMLGTASSLLINGNSDCKQSVENIWKLSDPESIITVPSNNDKFH
ncbi:unnamed protein product [Rotaria magnacalcarata]|uniref:Uncharacterized protein n=2 Tax=Rotaria magnacalcarata TaxID=392030 RepID=A0A816B5Q2_9BILA|nr:unnamed protein product [Rotaria magnacalcarata]CAF1604990.1 unnamed protein product [Rotaria magnacalcarata]CAF4349324.1 unnamed protein product [Rotaria magnacalcarata]CAF4367070.1 unnamed protein product [Rotaria magnacalcarata]